jgi:hypothetical protein
MFLRKSLYCMTNLKSFARTNGKDKTRRSSRNQLLDCHIANLTKRSNAHVEATRYIFAIGLHDCLSCILVG